MQCRRRKLAFFKLTVINELVTHLTLDHGTKTCLAPLIRWKRSYLKMCCQLGFARCLQQQQASAAWRRRRRSPHSAGLATATAARFYYPGTTYVTRRGVSWCVATTTDEFQSCSKLQARHKCGRRWFSSDLFEKRDFCVQWFLCVSLSEDFCRWGKGQKIEIHTYFLIKIVLAFVGLFDLKIYSKLSLILEI